MSALEYGLQNNKIIHIKDVDSGLMCGCVCPGCGARLIARKGDIKEHHFAHEDGSDCALARETAIHILAKEILSLKKELLLPAFVLKYGVGSKEVLVKFDEVQVEQSYDDIIPDIVMKKEGKLLFVEIKVSHPVDEVKSNKIKSMGVSCIEIDLSKLDGLNNIESEVINNTHNKVWIFNAKEREYYSQVEYVKNKTRLKAWWFDLFIRPWGCPLNNYTCNDCNYLMEYEQLNQTGHNYKYNPDFVYCKLLALRQGIEVLSG